MLRSLTVGRVVLVLAVAGVFGMAMGAGIALVIVSIPGVASSQPTSVPVPDPLTDYVCYESGSPPPQDSVPIVHINPLFKDREEKIVLQKISLFCTPVVKDKGFIGKADSLTDYMCYQTDAAEPASSVKIKHINPLFKEKVEDVRIANATPPFLELFCTPVVKEVKR